jgi:Putative peptidoglycan binding domain
MSIRQTIISVTLTSSLLVVAGCTTMESQGTPVSAVRQPLPQQTQEFAALTTSKAETEPTLAQRTSQDIGPSTADAAVMFPPKAKPGECYARVFVPPTYNTVTEQVLKRDASERLETIPAKYEWVEETVAVQEPSEKLEVVPATYEWVEERVLVKPATSRVEVVPPEYETVTEQVLVRPAQAVWKKGTGPLQRIDHATGEIMCLVEEPAVYNTVTKRVLKNPATSRTVQLPAEYTTIQKRVLKTPATTRTVQLPGEYKTVKSQKLVAPEQVQRVPVPAEYETVSKQVQVGDGRMEWSPVLCETNATPGLIMEMQRALRGAGYDPGPINGRIGPKTLGAVETFQRTKGLAQGGITLETLQALSINTGV